MHAGMTEGMHAGMTEGMHAGMTRGNYSIYPIAESMSEVVK